jgi:alpha-galactosidase
MTQIFEFGLKSLIGTLPIVLGDPRKLSIEKRANIKAWSDWMQEMQRKYDYMSYRRDLPGFGEPKEGSWDGWQRINFQTKKGGVFGVFRQGALEGSRRVFLNDLSPDAGYQISLAPEGKIVYSASGFKLMEEGFDIEIIETYDGSIYEVRQL